MINVAGTIIHFEFMTILSSKHRWFYLDMALKACMEEEEQAVSHTSTTHAGKHCSCTI